MTKFDGLIVGGPQAGKRITCDRPYYQAISRQSIELWLLINKPQPIPAPTLAEVFQYKHVVGLRGAYEIDFWVPHDKDSAWAFQQLVGTYEKVQQLLDRLPDDHPEILKSLA